MRARTFGVIALIVVPVGTKVLRDLVVTQNRRRYAEIISGRTPEQPPAVSPPR